MYLLIDVSQTDNLESILVKSLGCTILNPKY
jgi:hypothetical protein